MMRFFTTNTGNTAAFLTIKLTILLIIKLESANAEECPCFTESQLRSITLENASIDSCHPNHPHLGTIGLWKTYQDDGSGRIPFNAKLGYEINIPSSTDREEEGYYGEGPLCTMEGDMLMVVTEEQGLNCQNMIRRRCSELGLPVVQIGPSSQQDCPCFTRESLERITLENVEMERSCKSSRRGDGLNNEEEEGGENIFEEEEEEEGSASFGIWEKVTTTSRSVEAIPLPDGEEDENTNDNAPQENTDNSNNVGDEPLADEYELFHSALGYEVISEDDDTATCVIEGDMLMTIPKEEGEGCKTLIRDRCLEMDLLELE